MGKEEAEVLMGHQDSREGLVSVVRRQGGPEGRVWSDGMSGIGIRMIYQSGARWVCQMGTAE